MVINAVLTIVALYFKTLHDHTFPTTQIESIISHLLKSPTPAHSIAFTGKVILSDITILPLRSVTPHPPASDPRVVKAVALAREALNILQMKQHTIK